MSEPTHDCPANSHPDRRRFIKVASSVAAGAMFAPAIHAADKSGARPPVIGAGKHTYHAEHGWGRLPDHVRWGDTHGVCIDAAGLVYIKHRSSAKEPMDAICVFDADGKYVRSFGKEYHGGGHGIDVRKEGGEEFLYLSDIKNRQVVKTSLSGEQVWRLPYPQEPGVYKSAAGYLPTNVAFSPDGGFYIGDGYGSHYIHQYDKNAKWVRTFGGQGKEAGKLATPHGLWLDDRGDEAKLVVADRANARLQYFTLDGKHAGFVSEMSFPADIDRRGDELLVPDLHARVTILGKDNEVLVHLGYHADWTETVLADRFRMRGTPKEWQPGRFVHPHDACFDDSGNIFVVEWVPTGRVTKLTRADA